ncbi:uncharacterized protein J8A68_003910 [[Candida] subhashii]|uniref:Uncharacterized protein n=1 Tax=[Candida] subhashii TaxID=561895 RepID=A0A8J5UGP9_9ASCO|nr:uncharacterized protein J8A68_003910 [[Candida] subhashii]KAG7662613.1 hypothetical protein J8A68_003910 [[Candida] subhashii]
MKFLFIFADEEAELFGDFQDNIDDEIEEGDNRCIWYQVAESDSEPAKANIRQNSNTIDIIYFGSHI